MTIVSEGECDPSHDDSEDSGTVIEVADGDSNAPSLKIDMNSLDKSNKNKMLSSMGTMSMAEVSVDD